MMIDSQPWVELLGLWGWLVEAAVLTSLERCLCRWRNTHNSSVSCFYSLWEQRSLSAVYLSLSLFRNGYCLLLSHLFFLFWHFSYKIEFLAGLSPHGLSLSQIKTIFQKNAFFFFTKGVWFVNGFKLTANLLPCAGKIYAWGRSFMHWGHGICSFRLRTE